MTGRCREVGLCPLVASFASYPPCARVAAYTAQAVWKPRDPRGPRPGPLSHPVLYLVGHDNAAGRHVYRLRRAHRPVVAALASIPARAPAGRVRSGGVDSPRVRGAHLLVFRVVAVGHAPPAWAKRPEVV